MNRTQAQRTEDNAVQYARIQRYALIAGAIGLVLGILGVFLDRPQFFRSYLYGYIFWTGVGLGCLAVLMIQYLTGGIWGLVLRRPLEAGAMTLFLMALLFIPLVFGLTDLYSWVRPEVIATDELIQHKLIYLNVPFFVVRTLIYFVSWCALAGVLTRWSLAQDRRPEPGLPSRFRKLSAGGLVLFGLTITFALIDWLMSLEPHWFSSIYSAMVGIGLVLSAFAFVIVVVFLHAKREPLATFLSPLTFNDLGSLLFAFVMIWAYFSYSQYLLIWSGNVAEEITWYVRRLSGGWRWMAVVIILLHFALPFALLVSRDVKRDARRLVSVAALILLMRFVDLFWTVAPGYYGAQLRIHWLDIVLPIGIGGLWLAAYVWWLKDRPLLPVNDPRTLRHLERLEEEVQELHGEGTHGYG